MNLAEVGVKMDGAGVNEEKGPAGTVIDNIGKQMNKGSVLRDTNVNDTGTDNNLGIGYHDRNGGSSRDGPDGGNNSREDGGKNGENDGVINGVINVNNNGEGDEDSNGAGDIGNNCSNGGGNNGGADGGKNGGGGGDGNNSSGGDGGNNSSGGGGNNSLGCGVNNGEGGGDGSGHTGEDNGDDDDNDDATGELISKTPLKSYGAGERTTASGKGLHYDDIDELVDLLLEVEKEKDDSCRSLLNCYLMFLFSVVVVAFIFGVVLKDRDEQEWRAWSDGHTKHNPQQ